MHLNKVKFLEVDVSVGVCGDGAGMCWGCGKYFFCVRWLQLTSCFLNVLRLSKRLPQVVVRENPLLPLILIS